MTEAHEETTNPVTRLAGVIEHLYAGKPKRTASVPVSQYHFQTSGYVNEFRLGDSICDTLDIEPEAEGERYSAPQLVAAYAELMKMTEEAAQFTSKNSRPRARETNLKYVWRIRDILYANSHLSSIRVFQESGGYDRSLLDHLIAVGDNMSAFDNEKVLSEGEIQEIVSLLDTLLDKIRQSALDADVKDRMIQLIGNLRTQVLRINVIGSEAIVEKLDTFLGQTVKAVITADTSEKKKSAHDLFVSGVDTVGKVTQLFEYAGKIWPALEVVGKSFNILP